MKTALKATLTLIACIALTVMCRASVVIDSVTTVESNCPNNGSLTVFAQSSDSNLLYSIIDGPVTAPVQSSNVFSSLPPGVYQLLVTNFAGDTAIKFAAVFGSYAYPQFTDTAITPACHSSSDGRIIALTTPQTGTAPFNWQLTDLQTGQTITQATGVFNGLSSGNYTVRLTDACLNSTSHSIVVDNYNSNIALTYGPISYIHGCYSTTLELGVRQIDNSPLLGPLTIRISTRNGTYTKTANLSGNTITETVLNAGYNDTVNLVIKNTCGDSLVYLHYISPFEFYPIVSTTYSTCNQQTSKASVYISNSTTIAMPVQYTLYDSLTGNVVETNTLRDVSSILFGPHPGNRSYTYTLTDSCGAVYHGHFFWPSTSIPPPTVDYYTFVQHCLDSTAGVNISYNNFPHQPVLRLLSGPPAIGSSKPGYAYNDVLVYNQPIQSLSGFFAVRNLAAGTYQYEVRDNCGNVVRDSFTITTALLGDDNYSLQYIKGCPGENQLICNFFTRADSAGMSMAMGSYTLKNLNTGNMAVSHGYIYYNSAFLPHRADTVQHLDAGTYLFTINYTNYYDANYAYHPNPMYECWSITDTIVIPPYHRPQIQNAIKHICHGNSFIELHADSSTGMPPYTYEIIAGPQTAPAQSSSTFTLGTTGTYLARITDTCGTANTTSFTIDTAAFPPINKFGSSCIGGTTLLTYQSSPYLLYRWQKPNGTTYTGDTLIINPTTTADTGIYRVTKIVSINGCVDSFTAYYNLQQNSMHYLFDTICHGSSVTVGTHTYYTTGIYRDTLATTACDSIVILNLYTPYARDTAKYVLCPGQTVAINGTTYNATGIYTDTITGSGCDTIKVIDITLSDYRRGSQLIVACPNNNFTWNGRQFNQTGIYRDTLSTTGCDSVDVLYLSVPAIVHEIMRDTICEGESYQWGNSYYTYAGVYFDTLPSTPCFKTRELNLYVAAPPTGDTAMQNYTVEFYDSVTLSACLPNLTYQWNTGSCPACSTITIKPTEEYNYYQCEAANQFGCIATCHYLVKINGIYGDVFVPNVFTPNGDGTNDEFRLYGQNIRFHSLQVFNRLGEKVFDTENENTGWDGTYKGTAQPPGVYVYMLKYSPVYNAESRSIKGSVTLLK